MPLPPSRLCSILFATSVFVLGALYALQPAAAAGAITAPITAGHRLPPTGTTEEVTPTLPFSDSLDLRDSTAAYLQVADGSAFNLSADGTTIEFWVEIPPGYDPFYKAEYPQFVYKPGAYEIGITSPYFLSMPFYLFKDREDNGLTSKLTEWGWHHVAVMTYQDGTEKSMFLYIDGKYSRMNTNDLTIPTSDLPLRIAQGGKLRMDELRFSNTVRYPSGDFTPPTGAFVCDADTVALWHFDEAAGAQTYHSDCGLSADLSPFYQLHLPFLKHK